KCAKAQVIMGAAADERMNGALAVTVVATRRSESLIAKAGLDESAHREATRADGDLVGTQLDRLAMPPRSHSRFVPPPPTLSPEDMEKLMGKQAGKRPRK